MTHRRRTPPELYEVMKRATDIAVAAVLMVVSAPVMGAVAIQVRRRLGRPVVFRHVRPGAYGQPFTLYKFRTLTDARDPDGRVASDEHRLTPFGTWLRSTSLDELPELWNVIKGDMSLVGPRPLLMEYLSHYSPEQMRRHDVRPGITGWAQVNGRNAVSWEEKLAMDVWYVDHRSFALDMRIIWRTLVVVLQRRGVTTPGHATTTRLDEPSSSAD